MAAPGAPGRELGPARQFEATSMIRFAVCRAEPRARSCRFEIPYVPAPHPAESACGAQEEGVAGGGNGGGGRGVAAAGGLSSLRRPTGAAGEPPRA